MKIPFKKYIIIGIITAAGSLILGVIGFLIYFNLQFTVYQDDQYKFSIKYPKSWQVIVHPRANVAVIFVRPKDSILDTVKENFNVTIQPLPEGIFTLEDFSNRVKGQMIAVFGSGAKFVQYAPIHWGWRQGYKLVLEAPNPYNLKMVHAWVLNGNQAYILTFLGSIDKYPQDMLTVNEIIRSLQLQ